LRGNLALVWQARHGRFFLRAESDFTVATNIERLDEEPSSGPPIIGSYGGKPPRELSPGKSFLALPDNHSGGDGLSILGEPGAALSATQQMSMSMRMHELTGANSQFVIATHSSILMAYPDAWIYQISKSGLERVAYEETEHFEVTRNFLNRHTNVISQLLGDE
jgi:predicted ATPase